MLPCLSRQGSLSEKRDLYKSPALRCAAPFLIPKGANMRFCLRSSYGKASRAEHDLFSYSAASQKKIQRENPSAASRRLPLQSEKFVRYAHMKKLMLPLPSRAATISPTFVKGAAPKARGDLHHFRLFNKPLWGKDKNSIG